MAKINMARVFVGGLVAGAIINVGEFVLNMFILGGLWESAMKELGRPPTGNESIAYFLLLSFALGITMVWIYAAVRPRFGPGPLTAVCAGLLVWALAALYPSAGMVPMNLLPSRLLLYATLWSLVEMPLAAVAGAWLYRE